MNKKKIKILYTIPNFDTAGSGIPLFKLAQRLDKNIFEVEIACLHDKGVLFKQVKKSGIKIHIINLYPNARPIMNMLIDCYKLSKIFTKINPDIIHSYHYAANYTESIAARIAGIKWIYTKKNMSWFGPSYRGWRLRSFLSHGILCQNSDMMNIFFPRNSKAKLIPIGVDIDQFKKQPSKKELLLKWKINEEDRIIITVANLVPIKGIEVLIKAFSRTIVNFSNWTLLIVGNDQTEYAKELKIIVNENRNIAKKIIFTGKQSNVRQYLDLAEIFVLPTSIKWGGEGAPIAILEAMANKKVVLGSKIPGIKDQLNCSPQNLFKPDNEEDLFEKLKIFMSNNRTENYKVGFKFYNYVVANHNLSIEKNSVQNFYKKIIK